ncbi:MAG: AAA family ATPase [Anaerolineales bacterium]|nr:AAA family ATPase [Anaerolineales bacterium]
MKIVRVRIKNFRSIQDSGDIYLEDKITILAGKNESGKTAILHALEDFDVSNKIRMDAKSVEDPSLIPEIMISFLIPKERLRKLLNSIGIAASIDQDLEIEIVKTFPDTYSLSPSSTKWLTEISEYQSANFAKQVTKYLSSLIILLPQDNETPLVIPEYSQEDTDDVMITRTNNFLKEFRERVEVAPEVRESNKIASLSSDLEKLISDLKKRAKYPKDFIAGITEFIPTFIYFDSFESLLPYTLPLSEVPNNQAVEDFFDMANIDLDFLIDPNNDFQVKRNYLAQRSTEITGNFLGYWNQDKVELTASLNGENIVLGFKEDRKSQEFKMNQRSKGFQWFLSFYIQLNLHQGGRDKYLLVDEPGLYLHAKAQIDVLKVLESLSREIPIVFSTHSPYLLEYDKLPRVKLVFKDKKKGTVVESKYHKVSDRETLRPILTAIGLELTSGITNPDKLNNVIVEGASDWYYFAAFKKILDKENLNFIYGGGTGNMPHVGTILQGWGCKVLYLYDNDQGKKDGEKNLVDNFLAEKEQIKVISREKRVSSIEDLFTKEDFKKFVLNNEVAKYEGKNSEYIANQDKVLKAKLFHSNFENIKNKVSEQTKTAFAKVMDDLLKSFQ